MGAAAAAGSQEQRQPASGDGLRRLDGRGTAAGTAQDVGGGMAAAVAAEATTAVATAAAAAWILRAHRTAQGQHGSVEDEEVEVPEGDSYGQC